MLKALGMLNMETILDLVAPGMDEVFDGAAQSLAESLMPKSYKHFHKQKRALKWVLPELYSNESDGAIYFHLSYFLSHVGDKALKANPQIFSNMRGKRHPMLKQILKQMMPHLAVIFKFIFYDLSSLYVRVVFSVI